MKQLIATLLGGALALVGSFSAMFYNSYRERKSLSRAFAGEIQSLLALVRGRNYRDLLEDWRESLQKGGDPPNRAFMAAPKHNYFCIFDANADKIGLLPQQASILVVHFYVLAKAFLEDATNSDLFSRKADEVIKTLDEDIQLVDKLLKSGDMAIKFLL